jgi:tRNA (adenine37-N6)-methyltransferase
MTDAHIRPGEAAVTLPGATDAGIYFIGVIYTPWRARSDCPKRGDLNGPVCRIVINALWRDALTGVSDHSNLQILYWMHHARRDLVLQTPYQTGRKAGTFALRSPVRPNPIASSVVALQQLDDLTLHVRGLDCLDGTPLVDIKPHRNA